jgi:hypothetical protein
MSASNNLKRLLPKVQNNESGQTAQLVKELEEAESQLRKKMPY